MRLDRMFGLVTAGICSGTFLFVRIVVCPLCVHVDYVLVAVFVCRDLRVLPICRVDC